MGILKPKIYKIFDAEPIADVCSTVIEMCYSYDWSLQVTKDSADGDPLITIEVSNDGVNWNSYHDCAADVLLDDDSIRFIDSMSTDLHYRVCMKANGTTTGTITAILTLKSQ